jgi:hypothetical protein
VAGTSAPISLAPSPCVGVRLHACVGVACGRRPCVCMRPAVRACMACGLCCVCACVHAFACGVVCVHACLSCMRGCVCACDYACVCMRAVLCDYAYVCMHARRASAPQMRASSSAPQITTSSYVPCHLHVSRLLSRLSLQLWTSTPRILAPRRAISAPWFTAPSLGSIFRNLSKRGIFVKFFPQKGQKAKKVGIDAIS